MRTHIRLIAAGASMLLSLVACSEEPTTSTRYAPQPEPQRSSFCSDPATPSKILIARWMPALYSHWGIISATFVDSITGRWFHLGSLTVNRDTIVARGGYGGLWSPSCGGFYERDYDYREHPDLAFNGRTTVIRLGDSSSVHFLDSFAMPNEFLLARPRFLEPMRRDSVVFRWTPSGFDSITAQIEWYEPRYGQTAPFTFADDGRVAIPADTLARAAGTCAVDFLCRKVRRRSMRNGRPVEVITTFETGTQFVLAD